MRDYPVENDNWKAVEDDIRKLVPTILVIYTTITSVTEDLNASEIAKRINPDINCTTIDKYAEVEKHL